MINFFINDIFHYLPGFIAIILLFIFVTKVILSKKTVLNKKPYLYSLPLLLIGLLVASFYLLARAYLAEFYFKKSLAVKNVKEIYDYQRLAIITNPFIERFRLSFSQTNLLIANSLAIKVNTPEVEPNLHDNTSGVNELSAQDRQTISKAIQAAIEEAKAAVRLNEKRAANWENLAMVYRHLLNTADGADAWAISSYQRAIVLDPQNPKYRLDLGGVYYTLKNYDQAQRLFEQAASLKPDWPNAHYNLAWALFQKEDYQRAISEMQTVLSLLDKQKDKADYEKAKKDLKEFKLKISQ